MNASFELLVSCGSYRYLAVQRLVAPPLPAISQSESAPPLFKFLAAAFLTCKVSWKRQYCSQNGVERVGHMEGIMLMG